MKNVKAELVKGGGREEAVYLRLLYDRSWARPVVEMLEHPGRVVLARETMALETQIRIAR